MVRALALRAVAPRLNPILTSGLDLFPVVPDSTQSTTLCKWPTGYLLPVGVLNNVSVKFERFLSDY